MDPNMPVKNIPNIIGAADFNSSWNRAVGSYWTKFAKPGKATPLFHGLALVCVVGYVTSWHHIGHGRKEEGKEFH